MQKLVSVHALFDKFLLSVNSEIYTCNVPRFHDNDVTLQCHFFQQNIILFYIIQTFITTHFL